MITEEMQELIDKIIEEQSKLTIGDIKEFGEYEAYKKVLMHILNFAKKGKTVEK